MIAAERGSEILLRVPGLRKKKEKGDVGWGAKGK